MNTTEEPRLRKFNPGTGQTDREIIDQFVVRGKELGIVLDVLRDNLDAPSCQHLLVVAPRGRGKTMLIERVAAEIRRDARLSKALLPVRFMEESFEVFNIGEFWLECLLYLANAITTIDPDRSRELRRTRGDLMRELNTEILEQRARGAVLSAADTLDRKLVLMVENLQDLCRDAEKDFGWRLRKILQTEPSISLLATATSRFKALDDVEQPFYEQFRTIHLEPLNSQECRQLWHAFSGDEITRREIKPLQILTGGSPRLLMIVAEFARHRSIRQLMDELVTLIDNHTEYFRSHLDAFAKTERRVYLAVIDLWQPSTTAEIAERARVDVRKASALLGRLGERGAVLAETKGRKNYYSATERLYSIYYKLRKEHDEAAVVRNLIRFMTAFYSESELTVFSRQLIADAEVSSGVNGGLTQVLVEIPQLERIFMSADSATSQREGFAGYQQDQCRLEEIESTILSAIMNGDRQSLASALSEGKYQEIFDCSNQILMELGANDDPPSRLSIAYALNWKGVALWNMNQPGAEIETYDAVVARFGDSAHPPVQEGVARAMVNKGHTQRQMNQADEALKAWTEVINRFGSSEDSALILSVLAARVSRIKLLITLRRADEALNEFCVFYEKFSVGNNLVLNAVQELAIDLVISNISARKVLDILLERPEKAETLQPLIVALQQECGENVRAPAEVMEVAADISAKFAASTEN